MCDFTQYVYLNREASDPESILQTQPSDLLSFGCKMVSQLTGIMVSIASNAQKAQRSALSSYGNQTERTGAWLHLPGDITLTETIYILRFRPKIA
ncbi:unnamed protein product [Danaus chrysippus]|uniref:(African queen) hypothetical protein n=1 Tax=Danaus chrysippus TaxID=151541 RepID=A0A8J2VV40_9NEOP|nr:unnamed protein product [Danaus chrysippus]